MRDRTAPSKDPAEDLDPSLGNLLFDVWLLSRATTALVDDALNLSELDSDEFAIYSVLASGDGMTPTELARWMAAPTTTVSSYVKRFENREHVQRVVNPADGRSHHIKLTSQGRRAHQEAGQYFLPVLHRLTQLVNRGESDIHEHLLALRNAVDELAKTN